MRALEPKTRSALTLPLLALLACSAATPAHAQAVPSSEAARLQAQLERLDSELRAQRQLIDQQAAQIAAQQKEIESLRMNLDLAASRGAGMVEAQAGPAPASGSAALPNQPVGEAPDEPSPEEKAEVLAIPRDQGVLTPRGQLVFDPYFEYDHGSTNRLVFRGIELVPGIQIGLIEASDADRDAVTSTPSLRYGITNRIEIAGSIPYIYRSDRIQVVQQREGQIVRGISLKDDGIGDAEATIRYQLNRVRPLHAIWIASLRVKSRTGTGPFEIPYDEFGVAQGLATGSGFWGVQPGVSFLLPSDPIVLYGGLSYFHQFPKDIDRTIGETFIGRVKPGGTINANIGFGFALNPRFSYSLGVRHAYIFPTETEIGETLQHSARLQVAQLQLGMSYRVTELQTVNLGFEFGVTKDAPDFSVTLRVPIILLR
ncbi:MAG TPA: hypothetical protein VFM42_08375 [Sphingomicrobium sp.]|nr:hypothetical protein [Sphingomicrobium sp.]